VRGSQRWVFRDEVPDRMKELLVAGINSIIDGSPIGGDPSTGRAFPPAEVIMWRVPCEETARDRKAWLDDVFGRVGNPTQPDPDVSPFIRQNDSRMPRKRRA